MEINKYDSEIVGVVPVADVVESRLGIFVAHTFSYDWGSQTDLPGFRIPATAEEAKNAKQIITWAVDNRPTPLIQNIPSFTWAMRQGGWDQAANAPFNADIYLTYPGNQNCRTIPSGVPSLAFGKGTYTVTSGCGYIYAAGITVPGSLLQVANTAEDGGDAGKLKTLASMSDRKVGQVIEFHTSDGSLTFELD